MNKLQTKQTNNKGTILWTKYIQKKMLEFQQGTLYKYTNSEYDETRD